MEKNVQTALLMVDWLIDAHQKYAQGLENLVTNWTSEIKDLALLIASNSNTDAKNLEILKAVLLNVKRVEIDQSRH